MIEFINITSDTPKHVNINIDLESYIETFEKINKSKDEHSKKEATTEFNNLYNSISRKLIGISGQMYWIKALDLATQNLTNEQAKTIKAAPASEILQNSFIEIMKNAIDEAISRYYDSNMTTKPSIQLMIDIDDTSYSDVISIQIKDSGPGFENKFLQKLQTKKGLDEYVNASNGSNKKKYPNRAPLFGGQGRGLRILIADANGDVLERGGIRIRRFIKPEISRVDFNNSIDKDGNVLGAKITIITSIKPREIFSKKINTCKERLQEPNSASNDEILANRASEETRTTSADTTPLSIELNDIYSDDEYDEYEESTPPKFFQTRNSFLKLNLDCINTEYMDTENLEYNNNMSPTKSP